MNFSVSLISNKRLVLCNVNGLRWKTFTVVTSCWKILENRESFPPQTICIIRYHEKICSETNLANNKQKLHSLLTFMLHWFEHKFACYASTWYAVYTHNSTQYFMHCAQNRAVCHNCFTSNGVNFYTVHCQLRVCVNLLGMMIVWRYSLLGL